MQNPFYKKSTPSNAYIGSREMSYHPSLGFDASFLDEEEKKQSENFLANLFGFNKDKKSKAEPNNRLNHIYLALNRAFQHRDFLEVSVPGDATIYQSILLELDPDEKTVLIDEFFPSTFVGLPGQKMRFSLRQSNGRSIKFDANIMERHVFEGSPVYVIDMPETLNQDQRRTSFRVSVPAGEMVNSTFVAPDNNAYNAKLCDVSSSGICMETHGEITKALRAGDSLKNTAFSFAGVDVVCDLTVKNTIDMDDSNKRIGAEFDSLSSATRRQLEQSIMQLQRDQLRRAEFNRDSFIHSLIN